MRAVVTGAGGFIGSHLSEALCALGHDVLGIDCLTDYYDPAEKRRNLEGLLATANFSFVEVDLRFVDLVELLDGASVVFHQAGQPGVRKSWSTGFGDYCEHNVKATQCVLEAVKELGTPRLVYASSSSVYGNAPAYPTVETDLPRPFSPYGVTKLAAEHLCSLYAANWGVPTVSLRYFTVYGPRQRPDMAMRRLADAAVSGTPFRLFGDGGQIRDFTFVADVVAANLAAAGADVAPGTVVNIAGGSNAVMRDVIDLVGELAGTPVLLEQGGKKAGDVERTGGAVDRARDLLGWEPRVGLRQGLAAQVAWCRSVLRAPMGQVA
ncbi:MAG TPA: NAD-dependent epimerase/dehydratase family protein [Acidimicrobiales bacterium]|nr:NAD-dependent epimerase/dehydratase family protein [Acidimicrobiales bacterium]